MDNCDMGPPSQATQARLYAALHDEDFKPLGFEPNTPSADTATELEAAAVSKMQVGRRRALQLVNGIHEYWLLLTANVR